MIKVGIVGGTGYTGVELLRLLAQHPQAEVVVITSRSEDGVKVTDLYPNLRGHYDGLAFSVPDVAKLGACDVVFFATPHGVAHALAGELLEAGTRVIDLSADGVAQGGVLCALRERREHVGFQPALAQQEPVLPGAQNFRHHTYRGGQRHRPGAHRLQHRVGHAFDAAGRRQRPREKGACSR